MDQPKPATCKYCKSSAVFVNHKKEEFSVECCSCGWRTPNTKTRELAMFIWSNMSVKEK